MTCSIAVIKRGKQSSSRTGTLSLIHSSPHWIMDQQSVKELLESGEPLPSSTTDALPGKFYNPLIMHGVEIELIEPGHVLCSIKVSPPLLNGGNFLHGGVAASLIDIIGTAAIRASGAPTTGVTVEISTSYLDNAFLDEVVEIEAKALRVGKAIGVVHVELRKKKTGKLVAQSRLTKYLTAPSKL